MEKPEIKRCYQYSGCEESRFCSKRADEEDDRVLGGSGAKIMQQNMVSRIFQLKFRKGEKNMKRNWKMAEKER
jgi:hypothetical protein